MCDMTLLRLQSSAACMKVLLYQGIAALMMYRMIFKVQARKDVYLITYVLRLMHTCCLQSASNLLSGLGYQGSDNNLFQRNLEAQALLAQQQALGLGLQGLSSQSALDLLQVWLQHMCLSYSGKFISACFVRLGLVCRIASYSNAYCFAES